MPVVLDPLRTAQEPALLAAIAPAEPRANSIGFRPGRPAQADQSDPVRGVLVDRSPTQFAADPLTLGPQLAPVQPSAVAQLARAQTVAVPQPGPVTVAAPNPGIAVVRVRQIADTVGVVVDFGTADVAKGDTDLKRDLSVGTRHGGTPRVPGPGPLPLGEGRTGAIG